MQKAIKEKLPQWYTDINSNDGILITTDLDALLSYHYLHKKFGCRLVGFFNFNEVYLTAKADTSKIISVDLDIITGRTFGNHFTYFYKNKSAINLNNLYDLKYYQKYPLSTVLLILSLYDYDMESMTDEQLKIILAIDSAYQGYYTDNDFFKQVYLKWLDRLDIRFLEDRILKHMKITDWVQINRKYNLKGNIIVTNDGELATSIYLDKISEVFNDKIELPQDKFNKHRKYQYKVINPNNQAIPPRDNVVCMAWTNKNELKLTIK